MAQDVFLILGSQSLFSRYRKIFDVVEERGYRPFPIVHEGTPGEVPGALVANLYDFNATMDAVREATRDENIAGAVCCGEDYVNTCVLMFSMLNLPSPGLRAGVVSRNKFLQRVTCAEYSPKWRLRKGSTTDWNIDFAGPYVIKPLSRHSSSGVVLVDDEHGIADLIDRGVYQSYEEILVEEFVPGREVTVESVVYRGEVLFESVSDTKTGELPHFVELRHTVPAVDIDPARRARIAEVNAEVIRSIGVENSVTHAEYRLADDGRVVLMEIAVRLPGDAFSLIYQAAYGVSLEEQLVAVALDEKPSIGTARRLAVQNHLRLPESGRYHGVTVLDSDVPVTDVSASEPWPDLPVLDADAPARLRAVLQHMTPGGELAPLLAYTDRVVSLVVDGPLGSAPEALIAEADSHVEVHFSTEV